MCRPRGSARGHWPPAPRPRPGRRVRAGQLGQRIERRRPYARRRKPHIRREQRAAGVRKFLPETDSLSPIGGDGCVALIADLDGRQDAMAIASKILNELAEPFSIGPEPFRTSVSIGVAVYPGDGPNEEELIPNADLAMYQGKRKGMNGIVFFSS